MICDFNYKLYLCNGCHDLMQKAMNFNVAAVASSIIKTRLL